ncbi:MAG: hypothetical protein IPL19_14750 [Sandaracinaceae bacterium]|nr:hypothetical protein [Sandaracinaceae bacterium]
MNSVYDELEESVRHEVDRILAVFVSGRDRVIAAPPVPIVTAAMLFSASQQALAAGIESCLGVRPDWGDVYASGGRRDAALWRVAEVAAPGTPATGFVAQGVLQPMRFAYGMLALEIAATGGRLSTADTDAVRARCRETFPRFRDAHLSQSSGR